MKKKTITISMSASVLILVRELAGSEKRSISSQIDFILEAYFSASSESPVKEDSDEWNQLHTPDPGDAGGES